MPSGERGMSERWRLNSFGDICSRRSSCFTLRTFKLMFLNSTDVLKQYGVKSFCESSGTITVLLNGLFWLSPLVTCAEMTCKAVVVLCHFQDPCWWSAPGKHNHIMGRSNASAVFPIGDKSDIGLYESLVLASLPGFSRGTIGWSHIPGIGNF